MKSTMLRMLVTAAVLLAATLESLAQSTAFTYQGRLQDGGAPATGPHDFEFRLFNAASGGAQHGPAVTLDDLGVTNGLFTAILDFGANFPGADRFLQISVRPGVSTGVYTSLNPRQPITSAPYAVKALEAARLPAGALSSVMLADGAVTSSKLAPGAVSQLGASDGSPVNAVQVNTNGLVGIGTNAPQAGLHLSAGRSFINMEVVKTLRDENGGLTNLNYASAVAVDGNLMAVVATSDNGLTLFDVTNPSDPGWTAQVRDGDSGFAGIGQVYRVALRSNLLAVASYSGVVSLLNVSNRYAPILLAQFQDGLGGWNELNGINSLAFSGNLLAIAARNDSAVTLVDVSNPANPIKRAELKDGFFGFTNLWGATALAFKGTTLFIGADQAQAVTVVDVSNPSNPVKLVEFHGGVGGFQPLGFITAMAVAGNTLAVGSESRLTLVAVANPAAPLLAAQLDDTTEPAIDDSVSALAASGSLLAVAYQWTSKAVVLNVSQPAVPVVHATTPRVGGGIITHNPRSGVAFAQTNLLYTFRDVSAVSVVRMTPRSVGLVSAGWVGIGIHQPEAPLHVVGDMLVESTNRVVIRTRSVNLGLNNTVEGDRATVGGGTLNYAGAQGNTIAGGGGNHASGDWATIGGGYENRAAGFVSTIGGGQWNQAHTNHSVVGGGYVNVAKGVASVVPGGSQNVAAGDYSAALGRQAQANHAGSLVWADAQGTDFSSTLTNQFSVRASGGVRLETGGAGLTVDGQRVLTAAGGTEPLEFFVNGQRALRLEPTGDTPNLIGGYSGNIVNSGVVGAVIAGGGGNGMINQATANYSTVVGGRQNQATGFESFVGGGRDNRATGTNAAVVGGSENQAAGWESFVGGGRDNRATGTNAAVVGGSGNQAAGWESFVGGGRGNRATGMRASVGGGALNSARGQGNSIAGGGANSTTNDWSTIGGGYENAATGFGAVVPGGIGNTASGAYSAALGRGANAMHDGSFVWADNQPGFVFSSTLANQFNIRASGGLRLADDTSLNFGSRTRQMINLWSTDYALGVQGGAGYFRSGGDFYWYRGGSHSNANGDAGSGGVPLMSLKSSGNLGLGTSTPGYPLEVQNALAVGRFTTTNNGNGAVLILKSTATPATFLGAINFEDATSTPGQIGYLANHQMSFRVGDAERMNLQAGGLYVNGAIVPSSDRNVKEDFAAVDAQEMLKKVAALPLQSWSYTNRPGVKHVGPMAQDFHSAFGLGEDDKHIATVDADGVALAAIQGLNQKLEGQLRQKDSELKSQQRQITALLNRLNALENRFQSLPTK
jgi:hypothetical protein